MPADGRSSREPLPDDCKLYVANLSPAFSEAMLKQMFEPFGAVLHVSIMKDGATGASRGFGFVHLGDTASAKVGCAAHTGRRDALMCCTGQQACAAAQYQMWLWQWLCKAEHEACWQPYCQLCHSCT